MSYFTRQQADAYDRWKLLRQMKTVRATSATIAGAISRRTATVSNARFWPVQTLVILGRYKC